MLALGRRVAGVGLVLGALLITSPIPGSATVSGGCTVIGDASVSGKADLTTTAVWHLRTNDVVTGTANYPTQTYIHASVVLFGQGIQVYSGSGSGTHGSAGPYNVSDYSRFTRVFAVTGVSDSCNGAVLIVVDDQNPFTTLAGLVALGLFVVGVIGLLLILFAGGGAAGCGSRVLGVLFGLLLGLGAAIVLAEAGLIDPRTILGLVVIGVGFVVGVVMPSVRGWVKGA